MKRTGVSYFGAEYLRFLSELKRNNDREWFNRNKGRFQEVVQEPNVQFVADAGPLLRKVSPSIVAIPKPFGGSIMRIYRDTRFSRDKRPYHTHIGVHFWHADSGKEKMAFPGYFLHVEPGNTGLYAGVWRPGGPALQNVRDRIAKSPAEWKRAVRPIESFLGESLKRPPPGFDADHPLIDEIKRKDFAGRVSFTDRQVKSTTFMKDFISACRSMNTLNAFVAKAIGARW